MNQLTNAQKELLQDMLNVYNEYLSKKCNTARDFISLAHHSGDIASSGRKYTDNKKVWEIRDNIISYLESTKTESNKLISYLINQH